MLNATYVKCNLEQSSQVNNSPANTANYNARTFIETFI